jgi:tape measure domain-containing protein
MANIRQDNAQLIITIDAKESAEYQKTLQATAKGVQDIKKLEAGTQEYNKVLNEQAAISRKLAQTDFNKLSLKQLQDRRTQLVQLQRTLPAVTFAEAGFEKELRTVNTALAENAQRTRAVNNVMRESTSGVKNFLAAYVGFSALQNIGQNLFEQIKRVDALNKSYEKIIPNTEDLARANEFLSRMSENYGLQISDLREQYLKYTASASASTLALEDQELVFESVAKASSVLGLSTETQGRAFTALQQIMSKGKVSAEELKGQLGDALPGAVTIMAKALGVGVGELSKMLEQGEVLADEALPKFARELQKAYNVENVDKIENITSAQNRFKNAITEVATELSGSLNNAITGFFNILTKIAGGALAFVKILAAIPQFVRENDVAIKSLVLGLVIFNSQMILAAANSLRLAAVEKGRAIITAAVTTAQNLLNAAMTANPIGLVIKAIGLLVIGFGVLYSKSQTVRAGIAGLGAVATEIFTIVKEAVGSFIDGFKQLKEGNFSEALSSFGSAIVKGNPVGIAFTQGKRLKDAFNKGFNDKIEAEKTKKEAEKQAKDLVDGLGKIKAATPKDPKDNKSTKTKTEKPKDSIGLFDFDVYDPSVAQAALDFRLKQMEEAAKREQSILEESYLQGKLTQEQYELERLRITQSGLATRIELLDTYGQQESDKRRELNIELLKIEDEIIRERAAQIGDLESAQLSQLESEFAQRLISEEEYNLSRLRIQLNFYDEQLRMLEDAGLTETDVYDKISSEKLKIQGEYNDKLVENERRTQALKAEIQREGLSVLSDLFSLGAELLGKDEKARKKHGEAIKKFETASIIINSIAEIAENYKQSAKLGPIIGPILGTIRAIATTVRAGIAISKVNAQQFFRGGKIRTVSGELIDMQPNIPAQAGGDNVLIAAKPGEVVLNKDQQNALGGPEVFKSIGVPGFNTGGVILPRTIPNISPNVISGRAASSGESRIDQLMMAVETMVAAVAGVPAAISNMDIKTHVVYNDFEKAQNTINEIKRLSSYGSN